MLWNASALNGYPIKATDGQLGTVAGVMYDESDWSIRWLVADTGDWLSGRRALLPVAALGQPDPDRHHLPVNLTMRQVAECPDFDASEPLSQETETMVRNYYDLPNGDDRVPADGEIARGPSRVLVAAPAGLDVTRDGSHVHRISGITGDSIEAADGDIGHAEDFPIDSTLWQVRFLTVHASSWWTDEKRLISPLSIDWIDRARSIIHLDVTCQKEKDSPPYVAAETVDGAFDELFHTDYGIRWVRR